MLRLLMLLPFLGKMLLLNDPPADPPAPPASPPSPPPTPPATPPPGGKVVLDGEEFDFPEGTPQSEMTEAQRTEYWRHKARKHESRTKQMGDYDDLKAKAARLEEIEAANATEAEKAAKAARNEGRTEGLLAAVRAEFRAAAKGVLTDDAREALLEDLDMSKYLTDKGEVDVERIEKKVSALAPATGSGTGRFPDLGQGRRPGGAKVSGKDRGLAEARKRFGEPAAAKS